MGRRISADPGHTFDVVDTVGEFVGRAIYDPSGPLCLRVFSRSPDARLDAATLRRVVHLCARRRRATVDTSPDGCFRVLNGDSEGVPAVNADRYADYLVLCAYSAVTEGIEGDLVQALVDCWAPRAVYVQRRYQPASGDRARSGAELVYGEAAPTELVVREGRTRFVVDVTAPLGTGLFADMRGGREWVARLAPGRRVVNCFSYTGAFSVVAALHGAQQVVSVDSAARAHGRARRNFGENRLNAGLSSYEFVTGDAFATLARFASRGRRFDMVVVDPPTFSTTKGRVFTASKDYVELVGAAASVLEPGGILCAASNAAKLSFADFERAVGRGLATAGREGLVLKHLGLPPDYPVLPGFEEGRYLKFLGVVVW